MPKSDRFFDPSAYALVADRIALFYARFTSGRIITELVARTERAVTFRASIYRTDGDTLPAATGWASEQEGDGDINTVACLENTETSAIGRALANLGFTASRFRPSREEMEKAVRMRARISAPPRPPLGASTPRYVMMLTDVLALVAIAERRGLRARRAASIRHYLREGTPLMPARLIEIERRLRRRIDGMSGRGVFSGKVVVDHDVEAESVR
ncbi:MAG: hypothetical protein ABJD07_05615 [Gemmatimonadaceae bacterium]